MEAYKINKGSFILRSGRVTYLCFHPGTGKGIDITIERINKKGLSYSFIRPYLNRTLKIEYEMGHTLIFVYKRISKVDLLEIGLSF